jgi:iron(III) transport system permease protein
VAEGGVVHAISARLRRPTVFDVAAGLAVLAVSAVILYALGRMLYRTVVVDGSFTLRPFSDALSNSRFLEAARNTLFIVVVATVLALVIASVFAWVNERTDGGFGWLSNLLPILPLLVPAVASAIGFVVLFSPRAGLVNVALRDYVLGPLGIDTNDGPVDVFTMYGMIFLYVMFLVPFAYLPISTALRNLDPAYEEAARNSGAGLFRTLRKVTIPAIAPALASAALITLVVGFALFTVPAIIGATAGINVVSTQVYTLINTYPPDIEQALAIGVLLLAVIALVWLLQRRISRAGHFATISGRARARAPVKLGVFRWPIRAVLLGYVALTSLLPFLALLYLSVHGFWTGKITFDKMSLDNYRQVFFDNEFARTALRNSILLGITGATISVVIVAILARYVHRRRPASGVVDGVTKLPATLSPIILALAFLLAFGGPPFDLQGTLPLLLLVYFIIYLPFGSTITSASYAQIGDEITEAARVCGGKSARTFATIELPLVAPGLLATWCLCFVLMTSDLTASVFLAGPNTPVVGSAILDRFENGNYSLVAALAAIMTISTVTIVVIAQVVGRRFLRRGPALAAGTVA